MRRYLPSVLFLLAAAGSVTVACSATKGEDGASTESPIINGTPASVDDAIVLVVLPDSFCTGTLIAPNLLLTARHCVSGAPADECSAFGADRDPSTIGVAIGEHPSSQKIVARGTKLFLETKSTICGQDIALVMLDQDVPGITPKKVRTTAPVAGELTTAVGYGEDATQQLRGRLQRPNIAVTGVGPVALTGATVPANDFVTGESVCHGDSGGPLFDAKGLVLGTTSRGTPAGCIGAPAIFSSTAAHIELIKLAAKSAGHPLDSSTDAGTDAMADGGTKDGGKDGSADASSDASQDGSADASSSTPSTTPETPPKKSGGTTEGDDDDDDDTQDAPKRNGLQTVPARSCSASPMHANDAPLGALGLALGALGLAVARRRRSTTRL